MLSMTRHVMFLWTALLSVFPAALSAPTKRTQCTNPMIRRNWDTLPQEKRDAFHKAVKCLQTKPSIVESGGLSKTLYDDYGYIHFMINQTVHKVASFHPWHRYFLVMRERDLSECGYSDGIPYWDWTHDADSVDAFKRAKIFDPKTGFGRTGFPEGDNSTASCVENGPYAGMQLNFPEPHCLRRSFNLTDDMPANWTSSVVKQIMDYPDYISFWNNSERIPHDHIHRAIGGDLRRQYSPNEPLFFIHHAQTDRLWTLWQGRNETRLSDYGGNTVQNQFVNTASLNDKLSYMGLAEDRTVESLMDTMSNGLCYKYDDEE
ncbi:tyrosinase tyrosinase: common central domain protein [Rhizoctonia solani AG-3 Rhs1AP]|uniref:Tyrosinase tyrosinase: common central domain protein n=1 Tax=Rhizoctonia solani AG-3 Rhs1AP TaxID=1086054 RepID=X8J344_9AGAM|nr:tyrosinase tyrosinase: common central domain protein [Rhizoctonia solani AG-3 Rhs1AP]